MCAQLEHSTVVPCVFAEHSNDEKYICTKRQLPKHSSLLPSLPSFSFPSHSKKRFLLRQEQHVAEDADDTQELLQDAYDSEGVLQQENYPTSTAILGTNLPMFFPYAPNTSAPSCFSFSSGVLFNTSVIASSDILYSQSTSTSTLCLPVATTLQISHGVAPNEIKTNVVNIINSKGSNKLRENQYAKYVESITSDVSIHSSTSGPDNDTTIINSNLLHSASKDFLTLRQHSAPTPLRQSRDHLSPLSTGVVQQRSFPEWTRPMQDMPLFHCFAGSPPLCAAAAAASPFKLISAYDTDFGHSAAAARTSIIATTSDAFRHVLHKDCNASLGSKWKKSDSVQLFVDSFWPVNTCTYNNLNLTPSIVAKTKAAVTGICQAERQILRSGSEYRNIRNIISKNNEYAIKEEKKMFDDSVSDASQNYKE